MDAPEFSHIVKLSEIGAKPRSGSLVANDAARRALAQRFDLPEISSLKASYKLVDGERGIAFTGLLEADLHQNCVIAGEAFPVRVEESFDILFVPKADQGSPDEEIELSEDECDLVEYEQAQIDLFVFLNNEGHLLF